MFKKSLIMFILAFVMMPMLSHSYSLTTRINSLAGQLQVASYPVQTSGSVMRSIPNVNPAVPVVITPAAGYVVSKVQQGTTYLTVVPAGQTVTIPANNSASQTINVWFDKKLVSVITSAGTGGSVSPSGTQNLQQGTAASAIFTPATGNKVISISGTPSGATCNGGSCSGPWATNSGVTVAFTVPATTVTMSAVFQSVIANAGSPQTVLTGSTTTLNGTASTGGSNYSWTQTSGTPVTLSGSSTAQPTFTASVAGSYQFRLVVTDGSGGSSTAYTTVMVTASATEAAQIQCQNCHQPIGVGVTANVYGNWSQSPHSSGSPPVMCYACHVGADAGGHPGPALSTLANICSTCHGASPQGHPVKIEANTCVSCHNPHSLVATMQGAPHFNSITSGMYPASYMTSKAACADCHYNSPSNASHRQEWNKSGHAATTDLPWIVEDFKTMSGCVQCHTTTGFIAYSTGKVTAAWGVASDKTKEVLRCSGCHKDVANGIVRTMAPVRPYADDTYTNRDVGKSNLCMACHSGRRNGASITVQLDALANFTNLPFIDPHNHASGGNLHGKSGYHFPGQTYAFYSTNSHRKIGSANFNGSGTSGPCIACHRNDTNSHSNKSLVNTLCSNCHGASFTADQLYVDKQGYTNALVTLNAMLAAKGHPYSPTQPYFSNTNWGVGQEGANTMGAAFNYVMLRFDNGAYAHNSAYAKQLIFDSIDYLYNGAITGSIEGALSYLVSNNNITQGAADSVRAYKAEINCTICHTYSTGSHPAHLNSGFGCVDCHSSTAASNTTIVPGNTTHVNGVPDLQAGPGRSFSYSAGTCSNISCHSGGSATWGSNVSHKATLGSGDTLMFTSDSNHDVTPLSITENCTLCHYESLVAQHNNNCAVCHSGPNAPANALIGNWDKSCQSCHPSFHTSMRANHNGIYWNSSASCELCHDSSGGEFPGPGDNCTRCHNPLYTAAAVGDHQAPTTTSNAQSTYVGGSSIHLTATDTGTSGVSSTWYSLDGNRWAIGNDVGFGAPISGSRAHTLYFYSTDHAMNVEATKSVTFTVQAVAAPDSTPPTTTSSFNPAANANFKANQAVTLTATDGGSGVKSTYYRIDSGAFVQGTSFTISGDGLHTFSYYSVDNANNTETTHVSNSFRIDTVAPASTSNITAANTYTGAQTFTLSPTDAGSGVAGTWYQLDSTAGSWTSGTTVAVSAPASGTVLHTLYWYSIDAAGNQEVTQSVSFNVQAAAVSDTTPPVTTSNFNPAAGAIYKANQAVTLTATDGDSGVKSTNYRIDSGAFVQGTSFTVSTDGLHTFSYYSVDNANNTETTHVSNSFRIDTVAPVTTNSAVAGTTYTGSQTFILSATDASGSGVASTWYQLDSSAFLSGSSVTVAAPSSGSASHTIFWYSIDNAGNQEATKSVTFTVQAPAGGGGGTATLKGSSTSPNHPYTHFWVNDATDTNLIADNGVWSSDVHDSSDSFVVPVGVAYTLHVEWEIPDYEGGGTGSDSHVANLSATSPGATVTWLFNLP